MSKSEKSYEYFNIKSKKPKRLGSSVSMEGDNFIVALDKDKVFSLTPGAYYVWIKCTGDKTVEQILTNISEELSQNPKTAMSIEELKKPVTEIIRQLSDAGLVSM